MTPGASVNPGGRNGVVHGAGVCVRVPVGRGVIDPLGEAVADGEGDGLGEGDGDGHGCDPMTFHE